MSESVTKELVKKILEQPLGHEWSVQGLGMMRLYLSKERRLHIWNSALRVPGVSEMHTHPWHFRSLVVAGTVINHKYEINESGYGASSKAQQIFCGEGGGLVGEPKNVFLLPLPIQTFREKETYEELAEEIHISRPLDGTVTIVKREFLSDEDHAWVYWPSGEWVSAEPRAAVNDEIEFVAKDSLARWFND